MVGATYLVRVLGVHVDLLVLFEPGVHLREFELNEPIELVVVVKRRCSLRAAVTDDDVVDVVLLRLEGVDEELLRDVLCLEEVIGVVWLEPPTRPRASESRTTCASGTPTASRRNCYRRSVRTTGRR